MRRGQLGTMTHVRVLLNVYDLHENNDLLLPCGLGLFHSGVHIGADEWTFASGGGVFSMEPKNVPNARFRETVDLGVFEGGQRDIDRVLDELRPVFKGEDYHIVNRNCNHFADAFVQKLLGREIPGYVNRLAYIGSFFSCLLPLQVAGQAPLGGAGSPGASRPLLGRGTGSSSGEVFKKAGFRVGGSAAAPGIQMTGLFGQSASRSETAPMLSAEQRREQMRAAAEARLSHDG